MQVEKIQLKSIKLETLNAECLMSVNRCVRYLRQKHNRTLKLQDADVLPQISRLVRKYDEPELNRLYSELKEKMVRCVNQIRLDEAKQLGK